MDTRGGLDCAGVLWDYVSIARILVPYLVLQTTHLIHLFRLAGIQMF